MKKVFSKVNTRAVSSIAAVLLSLPLFWKDLTGFYSWLSPAILLNSVFVLKSLALFNFAGIVILTICSIRKRWFCRKLCPVGWGCDLVSSVSPKKSLTMRNIPSVGEGLAVVSLGAAIAGLPIFMLLDPMAFFNGFFAVLNPGIRLAAVLSLLGLPVLLFLHLFFPGIWCYRICPLGGLQDVVFSLRSGINRLVTRKKTVPAEIFPGRRYFLASGAGLLAGLAFHGFTGHGKEKILRPPGSVPAALFNTLCIRCGSCIKVCPTKIIAHSTQSEELLSWMTPRISFDSGYCLETCNLCSRVCPSGAITLFTIRAKKQLFIGTAEVNLAECLLTSNTECDRCRQACKYEAVVITTGKSSLKASSEIIADQCVGCGACAVICPTRAIAVHPL